VEEVVLSDPDPLVVEEFEAMGIRVVERTGNSKGDERT